MRPPVHHAVHQPPPLNTVVQARQYVPGSNQTLDFPSVGDLVNFTIERNDMFPATIEIPQEVIMERMEEGQGI